MRSLFASAVIATLSQAVDVVLTNQDSDIDFAYAEHLTKFGLSYNSVEEYETRKARFAKMDAFIRNHNSKEGVSYTVGHNQFSDWSTEEKNANAMGLKRREATLGASTGKVIQFDTSSIPASIDWLAKGHTTAIKDQGQCGSCWSFMTTGTVESAWSIFGGDLYSLSEQQLVDCVTTTQGAWGCEGAYSDAGFEYYMETKLTILEKEYKYTAVDGTCTSSNYSSTPVQVNSWNWVTPSDGLQMKGAINQGPIGVSVAASCDAFMMYTTGVFDGEGCPNTEDQLDHAVQLIGYGADENGVEYMVLRNSWGTTWGMDGYMHIAYSANGNGVVGVNLEPLIPITANYNNSSAFEAFSGLTTFALATLALAFSF